MNCRRQNSIVCIGLVRLLLCERNSNYKSISAETLGKNNSLFSIHSVYVSPGINDIRYKYHPLSTIRHGSITFLQITIKLQLNHILQITIKAISVREITITIKLLPNTITNTITFLHVCTKSKLKVLLPAGNGTFIRHHY